MQKPGTHDAQSAVALGWLVTHAHAFLISHKRAKSTQFQAHEAATNIPMRKIRIPVLMAAPSGQGPSSPGTMR